MLLIGPNGTLCRLSAPLSQAVVVRSYAPEPLKLLQPMRTLVFHQRVRNYLHNLSTVRDTRDVRAEAGIRGQLWALQNLVREEPELSVRGRSEWP